MVVFQVGSLSFLLHLFHSTAPSVSSPTPKTKYLASDSGSVFMSVGTTNSIQYLKSGVYLGEL